MKLNQLISTSFLVTISCTLIRTSGFELRTSESEDDNNSLTTNDSNLFLRQISPKETVLESSEHPCISKQSCLTLYKNYEKHTNNGECSLDRKSVDRNCVLSVDRKFLIIWAFDRILFGRLTEFFFRL